MNKGKDILGKVKSFLQILKVEDEDFELDDDIQVEERSLSSETSPGKDLPEGNLKEQRQIRYRNRLIGKSVVLVLVLGVIFGFALYNKMHTFNDYTVLASYENEAVSGTGYEAVGKYIYRYNADGVSCVDRKNVMKWSVTFSMQAPISDVCGETMVIAEQQGNQVYIVNKDGLVGNFETLLPILKVRVSNQGVVAVVLQEDAVTWVNLYEADGSAIASNKTTVAESGYPLDIALSPDGQKLAVSYLKVSEGIMQSDVVFYHFGTAGQGKENHIVSSANYQERVIPEIYFTDNSTAVAITDNGYIVFNGSNSPEKSVAVSFDEEIVSTFHDEDRIGFLFRSTEEGYSWRMVLYSYRGRRKLSKNINASFDHIKMQNGQIIMYNESGCDIFTTAGYLRFSSAYEKEIADVFYFAQFRKYLIVTRESFDLIRIS